jgi:hypothetical protein
MKPLILLLLDWTVSSLDRQGWDYCGNWTFEGYAVKELTLCSLIALSGVRD